MRGGPGSDDIATRSPLMLGDLDLVELRLGVGQLVFDGRDAFREFGDFILQPADFPVRFLQAQQVFYFWKHPETALS